MPIHRRGSGRIEDHGAASDLIIGTGLRTVKPSKTGVKRPMPSLRGRVGSKVAASSAMAACEKAAKWRVAMQLLADLIQKTVQPDRISFSSCMSRGPAMEFTLGEPRRLRKGWRMASGLGPVAGSPPSKDASSWLRAHHLSKYPLLQANVINYCAVMSAMEKVHRLKLP